MKTLFPAINVSIWEMFHKFIRTIFNSLLRIFATHIEFFQYPPSKETDDSVFWLICKNWKSKKLLYGIRLVCYDIYVAATFCPLFSNFISQITPRSSLERRLDAGLRKYEEARILNYWWSAVYEVEENSGEWSSLWPERGLFHLMEKTPNDLLKEMLCWGSCSNRRVRWINDDAWLCFGFSRLGTSWKDVFKLKCPSLIWQSIRQVRVLTCQRHIRICKQMVNIRLYRWDWFRKSTSMSR